MHHIYYTVYSNRLLTTGSPHPTLSPPLTYRLDYQYTQSVDMSSTILYDFSVWSSECPSDEEIGLMTVLSWRFWSSRQVPSWPVLAQNRELFVHQAVALVVPQAVVFLVRPLLTLSEFACQKWPFLKNPKVRFLRCQKRPFLIRHILIGEFYQKVEIFWQGARYQKTLSEMVLQSRRTTATHST